MIYYFISYFIKKFIAWKYCVFINYKATVEIARYKEMKIREQTPLLSFTIVSALYVTVISTRGKSVTLGALGTQGKSFLLSHSPRTNIV